MQLRIPIWIWGTLATIALYVLLAAILAMGAFDLGTIVVGAALLTAAGWTYGIAAERLDARRD